MHLNWRSLGALVAMLCLGVFPAFAGEIRTGVAMHVKPNSIWFQDADKLTRWQQLKQGNDSAALAAYQEEVLSQREAWQFLDRLTVRILGYERKNSQVEVEMKTGGRLHGTKWLLDASAFVQ